MTSSQFPNYVHAVAGAVGGSTAMVILYPLEIARTRLQVVDGKSKAAHKVICDILKNEGIGGLYRGLLPMITTIAVSSYVYFYVYNGLKLVVLKGSTADYKADLILAFLAGCTNVLLTAPMWVINTRMKLQGAKLKEDGDRSLLQYKNMLDACYKICRDEGVSALWYGTLPSLVLSCNPAVQFMVYEALKRHMQVMSDSQELHGVVYFMMGAIAKMVATFVTYPLQIIQTRSRFNEGRKGMIAALSDLFRKDGFMGLYRGLGAKLMQTILNSSLMFLLYEKILHFIIRFVKHS